EVEWLVTDNETNRQRVFKLPNSARYLKDGISNYLAEGRHDAINPDGTGTKAAAHYQVDVPAGGSHQIRLLLSEVMLSPLTEVFGEEFDRVMRTRLADADEFYKSVIPQSVTDDGRLVARQAYAGMLWSKQFYYYPVNAWINDEILPPDTMRRPRTRNKEWFHLESSDIISMPDKWEYPWFAAWDLAFHCFTLAGVDLDFAKNQMGLITNQVYLHPNGQIPAYEWNFSDVNPPVHCK